MGLRMGMNVLRHFAFNVFDFVFVHKEIQFKFAFCSVVIITLYRGLCVIV